MIQLEYICNGCWTVYPDIDSAKKCSKECTGRQSNTRAVWDHCETMHYAMGRRCLVCGQHRNKPDQSKEI